MSQDLIPEAESYGYTGARRDCLLPGDSRLSIFGNLAIFERQKVAFLQDNQQEGHMLLSTASL